MSGQYKIQYSAMDEFYSQIDGRMAEWIGQLELWITAYKNIEMMESYKGKSCGICQIIFAGGSHVASLFDTTGDAVIQNKISVIPERILRYRGRFICQPSTGNIDQCERTDG